MAEKIQFKFQIHVSYISLNIQYLIMEKKESQCCPPRDFKHLTFVLG